MYLNNKTPSLENKQLLEAVLAQLPLSVGDQLHKRFPEDMALETLALKLEFFGPLTFDNLDFLRYFPQLTLLSIVDVSGLNKASVEVGSVSKLPHLEVLGLPNLGITTLDWATPLVQLQQLDLSGNQITDPTPLLNLPQLIQVTLTHNPLDESKKKELLDKLGSRVKT